MGRCYLCQQEVPGHNDETLFIAAIAAIYGTDHIPRGFSRQNIVIGNPQETLKVFRTLDGIIPHAHIYPDSKCQGSYRAREAVLKYPEAYSAIKNL